MSLYAALNSAVSALQSQSTALSAISTNIANASTTGYKIEDTDFDALVSSSASAASTTSDEGVTTSATRELSTQGEISSTTTTTNMAVDGTGYFVVSASDTNTSAGTDLYTRDGSFSVDSDGYLVNDSGDYLMGYATDSTGDPTSTAAGTLVGLTAINIPTTTTVSATSAASLAANLPSDLAVDSSVTNTMTVVDSQGVSQTVEETFTKTDANTWTVSLSDPYTTDSSGTETTTGTISPSSFTLTFDGDGVLSSVNGDSTAGDSGSVDITLSGMTSGAADSTFSWNLGTIGSTDGLTQYASSDDDAKMSVTSTTDNGTSAGTLTSATVATDGDVTATYSNGDSVIVAKVPVATFADQNGLDVLSGSTYSATSASGTAVINTAGDGGSGTITGEALEASTTDTATEFNKMIVAQQAYSAAAQVVTYVDKMFSTLLQAVE